MGCRGSWGTCCAPRRAASVRIVLVPALPPAAFHPFCRRSEHTCSGASRARAPSGGPAAAGAGPPAGGGAGARGRGRGAGAGPGRGEAAAAPASQRRRALRARERASAASTSMAGLRRPQPGAYRRTAAAANLLLGVFQVLLSCCRPGGAQGQGQPAVGAGSPRRPAPPFLLRELLKSVRDRGGRGPRAARRGGRRAAAALRPHRPLGGPRPAQERGSTGLGDR